MIPTSISISIFILKASSAKRFLIFDAPSKYTASWVLEIISILALIKEANQSLFAMPGIDHQISLEEFKCIYPMVHDHLQHWCQFLNKMKPEGGRGREPFLIRCNRDIPTLIFQQITVLCTRTNVGVLIKSTPATETILITSLKKLQFILNHGRSCRLPSLEKTFTNGYATLIATPERHFRIFYNKCKQHASITFIVHGQQLTWCATLHLKFIIPKRLKYASPLYLFVVCYSIVYYKIEIWHCK